MNKALLIVVLGMVATMFFSMRALGSPNQPNANPVGYEIIDTDIVHFWNSHDDYYLNLSSGIQLTNVYPDWWSHGFLCGVVGQNSYCADSLPYTSQGIMTDNTTFINISFMRTVATVNFTVLYNLNATGDRLNIIVGVKTNAFAINQPVGFAWRIKDLQINMNQTDNYARVLDDPITFIADDWLLNETLDVTYVRPYGATISHWKKVNDTYLTLDLWWDNATNTSVQIKSEAGQYNAPTQVMTTIGTIPAWSSRTVAWQWRDREYACEPSVAALRIILNLTDTPKTTVLNETQTEQPFVARIKWDKTPLSPAGSCTVFLDENQISDNPADYGIVTGEYFYVTGYSVRSVSRIDSSTIANGGGLNNSVWADFNLTCGGQHTWNWTSSAHLKASVAGTVAVLNSTANITCIDNIKPWIHTREPANGASINATVVTFKINASDQTNLVQMLLFVNGELNTTIDYFDLNYNVSEQIALPMQDGAYNWSVLLIDTNNQTPNDNMSLNWTLTVEHIVTDEAEARAAITEGISNIISEASVRTDLQLYTTNVTGHQGTGRFDKTTFLGTQRWAFNYLTGNDTYTLMPGLRTTVNVWEKTGLTYRQIVTQVETLINQTKT